MLQYFIDNIAAVQNSYSQKAQILTVLDFEVELLLRLVWPFSFISPYLQFYPPANGY